MSGSTRSCWKFDASGVLVEGLLPPPSSRATTDCVVFRQSRAQASLQHRRCERKLFLQRIVLAPVRRVFHPLPVEIIHGVRFIGLSRRDRASHPVDRLNRKLGLLGDNSQQGSRGSCWASPILLPILQRL